MNTLFGNPFINSRLPNTSPAVWEISWRCYCWVKDINCSERVNSKVPCARATSNMNWPRWNLCTRTLVRFASTDARTNPVRTLRVDFYNTDLVQSPVRSFSF
ncbi:hypothetical protein BaRGS_00006054 [Batillaria attramentaria]|uniref:Uncharacterized protein n=1 Tax=Batillaria attramentaria TaxID=370345 RepID=A0ABD0LT75_9CAEN